MRPHSASLAVGPISPPSRFPRPGWPHRWLRYDDGRVAYLWQNGEYRVRIVLAGAGDDEEAANGIHREGEHASAEGSFTLSGSDRLKSRVREKPDPSFLVALRGPPKPRCKPKMAHFMSSRDPDHKPKQSKAQRIKAAVVVCGVAVDLA